MPIPAYHAARDLNEPDIVKAFRSCGWLVVPMQKIDLLVQCPQGNHLLAVEVKAVKGSRLTPAQKKLREDGLRFSIVHSVSQVIDLVRDHGNEFHSHSPRMVTL